MYTINWWAYLRWRQNTISTAGVWQWRMIPTWCSVLVAGSAFVCFASEPGMVCLPASWSHLTWRSFVRHGRVWTWRARLQWRNSMAKHVYIKLSRSMILVVGLSQMQNAVPHAAPTFRRHRVVTKWHVHTATPTFAGCVMQFCQSMNHISIFELGCHHALANCLRDCKV